jgi:hypothetical protein
MCPDAETLAAFLDNRLHEPEREIIAAHLASCEACYFAFSEAARMQLTSAADGGEASWWTRPRTLSAAAVLAAAASMTLAVGLGVMPWQRTDAQLGDLVAAVGTTRMLEPRLTGGFNYGPLATTRTGQQLSISASPDVRIAAAEIDKETEGDTAPAALRLRAVAALMTGSFDAGVFALEQAASQRPNDARLASDLAAAYLVRHRQLGDAADVARALASANRALEVDARLAEAHFNRALAFERLGQGADARAAWQRYLEIDGESGWADEARARLRDLPETR